MSRAMRRQPMITKPPAKAPAFRPGGSRPSKRQQSAAAEETQRRKRGLERIPFIGRPLQEIISELKKVTWPTREETTRLGVAVIIVAISVGIMLGLVDFGFNWLVDKTLLR